ncbi:MAG: hypothetical protein WD075_07605, partial [Rhodospirillales bacterium]
MADVVSSFGHYSQITQKRQIEAIDSRHRTCITATMNQATPTLTSQRHLFDMDDDVLYFNAASKSAILKASVEAGQAGTRAKAQPWSIDEPARYVQADDIRSRFAALIGATGDDIAIQPAASYGIATAARNLHPKAGSRILM